MQSSDELDSYRKKLSGAKGQVVISMANTAPYFFAKTIIKALNHRHTPSSFQSVN